VSGSYGALLPGDLTRFEAAVPPAQLKEVLAMAVSGTSPFQVILSFELPDEEVSGENWFRALHFIARPENVRAILTSARSEE
jgi:hypothetical protein